MKKLVALCLGLSVLAIGITAFAAGGPETVTYENKKGKVTFNHLKHQTNLTCADCHTNDPPAKIKVKGMSAHKFCVSCHESNEKAIAANAPIKKKDGVKTCDSCHQQ